MTKTASHAPGWANDRAGVKRIVGVAFSPLPTRRSADGTSRHFERETAIVESSERFLSEAQTLFAARRDQALRAEARATTLQGSVGIAVGLVFTGSALLLDPAKIHDRTWRIVLAVFLLVLLFCLAMTGYIASRATVKVLPYAQPSVEQVMRRSNMPPEVADNDRALQLLRLTDENAYFSLFKIKQVEVAGLWFRAALCCFALLSALLLTYTVFSDVPPTR